MTISYNYIIGNNNQTCIDKGIEIDTSKENVVMNNIITNCSIGIEIQSGNKNEITLNEIHGDSSHGAFEIMISKSNYS